MFDQHRLDQGPGGFDGALPGERRNFTLHRVAQQALARELLAECLLEQRKLALVADDFLPGLASRQISRSSAEPACQYGGRW
jgi:hypothetical protein